MSTEYVVNYKIDVLSDKAIKSINSFKQALASLSKASKPLNDLQRQVRSLNETLGGLKKYNVNLNTTQAKAQLEGLMAMANELKATLGSINVGAAAKGAKRGAAAAAASKKGAASTSTATSGNGRAHTGHMPLTTRSSNAGWVHPGHPSHPMYRLYQTGALSQNDARRIDGQVRRANQARMNAAAAEEKAYQSKLKEYRDADVRSRWAARQAKNSPEAMARRAQRLEYLRNNRNAIYARHGITPEMQNAPIPPMGSMLPVPPSPPGNWRPSKKGRRMRAEANRGRKAANSMWPSQPKNIGYKLLGPTPLTSNGGMAIDMLKGMGIAYGIAGLGQLFGEIVSQSTEYDNTMQTVRNILKSHDGDVNFKNKFDDMSTTIREVGMETKYKVTEVADAAKFLAMAGLNTDAISHAIRPIADIALVGDTALGETADVVTNIMTAYKIDPARMNWASDVMTNTFTMSNTTLMEMAESYKYAAAMLHASNVDFTEATAAIGILGNAGIKGSQAGTTMRTLVANILNPTKKQRETWAKIGIDPNGKTLMGVFQSLHDKDIDAGTFFKLFHKTATSGALALAENVDRWKEIKIENELSEGLAHRLAEAKKNTIQGLWAQLASVFTDNGVTAFGGVQGSLTSFMKDTIAWLKTSEAKDAFQNLFQSFREFGKILIDVSKSFFGFYQAFKPFIMGWMKFQLTIWPYVKAFQALKTVLLSIAAIRGGIMSGMGIFGIGAAGKKSLGASMVSRAVNGQTLYPGPLGLLPGVTKEQVVKARRGLDMRKPRFIEDWNTGNQHLVDNWNKSERVRYSNWLPARRFDVEQPDGTIKRKWKLTPLGSKQRQNLRLAGYQLGNAGKAIGGTAAGMALMGYGMHKLTNEESSGWDKGAGGFYSLAGIAAMAGGPVGWGLAIGSAIAGGILDVVSSYTKKNKIVEAIGNFANEHKIQNGVLTNAEDDELQTIELMFNKHASINELVEKRIELTKKLLGLEAEGSIAAQSSETFDAQKKTFEDLKDWWRSDGSNVDQLIPAYNNMWTQFGGDGNSWSHTHDESIDSGVAVYHSPTGKTYDFVGATAEQLQHHGAAVFTAMNEVYAKIEKDMYDGVRNRMLHNQSYADWVKYFENFEKSNNPDLMPGLNKALYNLDIWNEDEAMKNYFVREIMWSQMSNIYEGYKNSILPFYRAKENGELTPMLVHNLLSHYGGLVGPAISTLTPDVNAWFKQFGYENGTFVENENGSPYENAMMAFETMNAITDALFNVGLEGEPATEALRILVQTLTQCALAFMQEGDAIVGEVNGQLQVFNGLTYAWNEQTQMWDLASQNAVQQVGYAAYAVDMLGGSIADLASTAGGYNWGAMWNGMLPSFSAYEAPSGWGPLKPENQPNNTGNSNKSSAAPYPTMGYYNNNTQSTQYGVGVLLPGQQTSVTTSITPQQAGGLKKRDRENKVDTGDGTKKPHGFHVSRADPAKKKHSTRKPNSSDYKSNYKNDSAAPKQVIVNISNLLNVQSIDMSKPDNKAVIDDLKSQLSQALVDVVHDFDATWHG